MQVGVEAAAETTRPQFSHVGGSGSEEARRIERRSEAHHTFEREQAEARLEAADTAEGGGANDRAERLRSERERHHPGRDRRGGARGTASGRVTGIARIARRRGIERREG